MEVREQYSLSVNEEDLKGVHILNPERLSSDTEIIDHVINKKRRVSLLTALEILAKPFCTSA
jgi:hypothetical protein